MLSLLSIALRNLFRNTRRTIITVSAIATGLGLMLFTITLQQGSYHDLLSKGVSSLAGHVVVQHPDYQSEREEEQLVTGALEVEAVMAEQFPDATVASRVFLGGLLMSPTNSVGAGLSAVQPEPEAKVGYLDDKLVDGEWLTETGGVVVGETMAESLGVELGDKLVYMGSHGPEDSTSKLLRVKGIYRTGAPEIDGFAAVIHIDDARDMLEQPDVAHQITLHLPDASVSAEATATVQAALTRDDVAVLEWRQALPELVGFITVDRSSADVLLFIIGVIVAMGVLNTVLMSVLERTREFGVLLAIGLKPRQLAMTVLFEGVFIGVLGALAGVVLGGIGSWALVVYGIDLASMMGGTEAMTTGGVPMDTMIYGQWHPTRQATYVAGAVVFTGLAALYPALHVARLRPVEAMRHV